ncbi:MAG: gliding motility-associated C-terminal domain-containing protein [Bacteroidota bacterium]
MPKNYWLKTGLFAAAFLLLENLHAQIQFKIALLSDSTTYQVSLYSNLGPFASKTIVNSAAVTVLAPTGELEIGTQTNQLGNWSSPDVFVNPVAEFDMDYFVFNLSGNIDDANLMPGQEIPIFSFTNTKFCAGAVELMDNDNDPYKATDPPFNIGNQITAFADGSIYEYDGRYQVGSANCQGTPPCSLTITSVATTNVTTCGADNGSITVQTTGATGTVQYSIDNGATYQTNATFSDLKPNNYTIKVKDAICESVYTSNPVVLAGTGLTVVLNSHSAPTCSDATDGTIRVAANGGIEPYQYSIDNGATWTTQDSFINLGNGTYRIKARNADSTCVSDYAQNPLVFATQPIGIQVNKSNISCNQNIQGAISITATGGSGGFQYSIDSGATYLSSATFSDLSAGNYHVMVRTGNGACPTTFSGNPVVITQEPIDFTATTTAPTCGDENNGSIIFSVNSPFSGNFEYSINDGATWGTNSAFTSVDTGVYALKMRRPDGSCETSFSDNPIVLAASAISVSSTTVSGGCDNGTTNAINVNASGGSGNFEHSIDSGQTWQANSQYSNLANGIYHVFVRNTDGSCTTPFANNPIVFQSNSINITVNVTPPSCDAVNDGRITVTATGGKTDGFIYSIDDGVTYDNLGNFTGLGNGNYVVKVKNADGSCETSFDNNPIQLNATALNLSVNATKASCSVANDGQIVLLGNGGTGNYEFSIDSGLTWSSQANYQGLLPQLYYLQVRNSNGTCPTAFSGNPVDLRPTPATLEIVSNTPPSCEGLNDGSLILAASGGNGSNFEYSIDNGITFTSSNIFRDLSAGEYTIQAKIEGTSCLIDFPNNPVKLDTPICDPFVLPTCVVNYQVRKTGSAFIVSMLPDTIWTGLNSIVGSAQITFRTPARNYQITQFQNLLSGVQFELTSTQRSPSIELGYDYFSATLSNFGTDQIPFVKGNVVDLFQFEINGVCQSDSLALVGEGSLFAFPNGEEDNVISQMTVSGWAGPDVPVCVQAAAEPLCPMQITSIDTTAASFCGATDGTITISTDCTSGHVQYSIDNGRTFQSAPNFTNLSAGNYFIRIKDDSTNCEVIYSNNPVVLGDNLPIAFTATFTNPTCADSLDGSIQLSASNGSGNYQHSIDDGRMWFTQSDFSGLPVGDFYLKVSNLDTSCIVAYDTLFLRLSASECLLDSDGDGQPDELEDLNMDGNLENDDTDNDMIPNYRDDDDDNDGILTAVEESGPNGGDGNGDGQPDCLQVGVATNMDDMGAFRTLDVSDNNCQAVTQFVIHPEGSMSESDPDFDFPFALNAFTIPCPGTVNINLIYHNVANFDDFRYRKYGPKIPGGTTSEWYDFPVTLTKDTIGGVEVGKVSFQLTDGQMGDATGVDTMIVDPGGIAMAARPDSNCAVLFEMETIGDRYQVSLTSDTSFAPPSNSVVDLQVTVRAPTNTLQPARLTNIDPNVQFELDTTIIAPTETPNFDYFVFKLAAASANTTNIDLFEDQKDPLFTFENRGFCAFDSLFLVGNGTIPMTPFINGRNLNPTININGWEAPTCVNGRGSALCEPLPRDTLAVSLFAGRTESFCLNTSVIQLPNEVDFNFVLTQGTGTTATTRLADNCVDLMARSDFSGQDYVTVVFCDEVNANICDTTVLSVTVVPTPSCLVNYFVEDSAGTFLFKMVSDTTWTTPQNTLTSNRLVIRVPQGTFNVTNLQNNIPNVTYAQQGQTVSNGFEYLNFILQSPGTADVPFIAGDTVCLFSFENGGACTSDSIVVVGPNSSVPLLDIGDEVVTSQLIVQGWGMQPVPICMPSVGLPICPIIPATPDTLRLDVEYNSSLTVCIDSVLQLLNNVGNVSICGQGTDLTVAVNDADSCVVINATNDYSGTTTLCVVHCDAFETTFCDTTYLVVTVESPPFAPTDTVRLTLMTNTSTQTCLGNALQLNTIGRASILQNGPQVTATVADNDDCLQLESTNDFTGSEVLVVVHCDAADTTFCDTTIIEVEVVPPPTCQFEYLLEATPEGTKVRLKVDSTIGAPLNLTTSMLVAIRVPNTTFNIPTDSITNLLPGAFFENTSGVIFDAEQPDHGYVIFDINNFVSPDYQRGDTLDLFSFRGITCGGANDSLFLVGSGAGFPNPTVNNVEITSYLAIGAFVADGGAPSCVSPTPVPTCLPESIPLLPIDTLHYLVDFESSRNVCIDSALQLPSGPGLASICQQGTGVTVSVTNGSTCIDLTGSRGFSGMETLCVVICDDTNTDVCDTTILRVTVEEEVIPELPECVVNFDLEKIDDHYLVSMTPDTTFPPTFFSGLTLAMNITVRAPTGQLEVVNLINDSTGYEFRLLTSSINPVGGGGFDYFTFALKENNTPTLFIPYQKGQKVDLFTFQNFNCSVDSMALVGDGAAFPNPSIGDETIRSNANVNGWRAGVLPVCVSPTPVILCQPRPDTFTYDIIPGNTISQCLDGVLQIPNAIGEVTIQSGNEITIDTVNGKICVSIVASNNFNTTETLRVIHCDSLMPDFCDTTYFILRVGALPCSVAITDSTKVSPTCSQANGQLAITATGDNLQYSFDNGTTFQQSNTLSNIAAGIYQIIVRDSVQTACRDSVKLTLTGSERPTITNVAVTDPMNCGDTDGSISIFATGMDTFLYSIDSGRTYFPLNAFVNLSTGTYNVAVVNKDTTCPVFYINNPIEFCAPCNVDAGADVTICPGDSTVLSATGTAANYSWLPTTGLSCTDCPNPMASPLVTTTYIVTNSEVGCNVQDTVVVTVRPSVTADFNFMTNCSDLSVNFRDTTSTTATITNWSWNFGDGAGIATNENPVYTYAAAGTYTVLLTVTTAGNCQDTISKTVTVGNGLTGSVSDNQTICTGDCVTLMASGGTTYQWDADTTLSATNIANPVACPTETTTYYVTIGNGTDCTVRDSVTITIATPTVGVSATASACDQNTGQITIFASLPNNTLEFRVTEVDTTWQINNVFSNLAAGNYTVAVRRTGGGCVTNFSGNPVVVNGTASPTIDTVVANNPTDCNMANGRITITATGTNPLIYSIDNGANWSAQNEFSGLGQGNYVVQVAYSDTTCTTAGGTINLVAPSAPSVDLVIANPPSTCGGSDGSLTIAASSNDPRPLQYSLDGTTWQDSNLVDSLAAGRYLVFVRYNDETCTTQFADTIVIEDPELPEIIAVTSADPSSFGVTDGMITISARGTNTLEYSINDGLSWQNDSVFTNLDTGTYNIKVRYDNGGCEVTADNPVILRSGLCLTINQVDKTDLVGCDSTNGRIVIIATSSDTLEYSVDNGTNWQRSNIFENLDTGTYLILVRKIDLSCQVAHTSPIVLNAGTAVIITSVDVTNPTGCGAQNGTITIQATGASTLEYSINSGISWQSSNVFMGLDSSTYLISVRTTDQTCRTDYNVPVQIGNGPELMITSIDTSNPDGCGGSNGTITIQATGSDSLEYSINNGVSWQSNSVFDNLDAGTYNISVRTLNQVCRVDNPTSIVLTTGPTLTITGVTAINPSGCGNDNGQISIAVNGGNAIEYSINNGNDWQTNPQFDNLGSGSYTIRVRSGSCEVVYDSNPVVLTAPNGITIVSGIDNSVTCNDTLVNLSVTLSENIDNYTVTNGTILNPTVNGATLIFDALVSGLLNEFAITFINGAGCTVEESFVVFRAINTEADFVVIEPYCKEMEVSLLFTGTATPMATLNWELDGGVLINSSPATATEPAGSEITVRWDEEGSRLIRLEVNDGGCVDDEFESIFVRKLPLVDAGEDVSICMGGCTQLRGTGTAVWYEWSPATGLDDANIQNPRACPAETTTYTLTVMSDDGCVSVDSVTVRVETNFLTTSSDVSICAGQSTTLAVSGASNYQWFPAATLDNPNSANPVASPTETTTYSVISPNTNGCMDTARVTVFVNPPPEAVACEDKTICLGDSIQLIVTTHDQYSWSPTNTLLNPTSGVPIAFPTQTTTYTVQVTDANGCTDTDEVTVFVIPPPTVNAGNDQTICAGNSVRLTASGATRYNWSPTTGLSNANLSNPIANPTQTTTYTVTGTDANGCTDTDQVTVFVQPNAGITVSPNVSICSGGSAQLSVTGGSNYVWSPATGLSNTNTTNPIANPTTTTTYTVTGVSASGCPSIAQVTVVVNPRPEAVACADKTICRGDSIQLTVTTHAQYSWSPASTLINPNSGTPIAFPTETTTYTVLVTDANGCTDTDEVTVFVNNPSASNLGPDITLCQGGQVELDAGPGTVYQWSPSTGLSNPTIRNPIATVNNTIIYTVEVTNASGCTGTDNITINVNGGPQAEAGPNVVLCAGETGQLNASGGVTYQWSPTTGLSNPNIANPTVTTNQVTTYVVTVTDQFGCTATDDVMVIPALPLSIDPVITNASCCGAGGTATLNVSGGFGNATFDWSPNVSTTNTATNLAPGFYKVFITDAEGCSVIFTFEIKEGCNACPDMFGETERCISDTASSERICVPISLEDIGRYEVTVNGVTNIPDHGCDFENLAAYSYALVEGRGNTGPYKIENWEVNGTMNSTEVEDMQELTQWMNIVDPTGNWVNNPGILNIIGGDPTKTYGTMKVVQLAKWIETMLQPDVTGVATATVIEVDLTTTNRPVQVIITDTTTCCSDTLLLRNCNDPQICTQEIVPQTQFTETVNCGENTPVCLPIPFGQISNYAVTDNGQLYTNGFQPCDFDSMFAYTYFTLPQQGAGGPYKMNLWVVNGQSNSGMFNTLEELEMLMNQIDSTGNWKLDRGSFTLTGGNSATVYSVMNIEQVNTGAIATLEINSNFIPMGTQLSFENGAHDVIIREISSGCQDQFAVTVSCSTIDNPPTDTTSTPPVDTTGTPIDTMTTPPVDTTGTPVDTMTTPPVDTTGMPVDTMATPVCTDFIAADFLSATMTRCDSTAEICVDIPFDSIGLYLIFRDNQPYTGTVTRCSSGSSVGVGVGGFTFRFEHQVLGCRDSLIIAVTCQTNARDEVIIVEEGETGVYCAEPDDLIGDIQTIHNACPQEMGTSVRINLDSVDFCLNYEGLAVGEEKVCVVLCDEMGVCDTTYVFFQVVPKSTLKPIAIGDVDSTRQGLPIVVDVLANDSIFGIAQNMEILASPTNGIVVVNIDGTITYTPNESFCNSGEPDTFMYGVCNENGCDTAMVEIWVPCPMLEIMNGFSPNNDGINDFFAIKGVQDFPDNELKIFNRWGAAVFEQRGYKNKWDGTFKDRLLPDGTYFYLFEDGKGKTYSGWVQISR